MSNAVEDFLHALQRTINGDPYPASSSRRYPPTNYRVVNIRDPLSGVVLSCKYRIESRIGKGAMSSVYKATQEPIGRTVALKVLNHEFAKDPVNIKRFIREAKTVGALRHRNILSIHDLGNTDEGLPFFVMEFLEGISLESLIDKSGAVAIPRALSMFCQICDGMSYAHSKGLIHRDLKPANIMLVRDEDGSELVKLVDFGIVKQTQPQSMTQKLTKVGEIWGSPVYMSPEQCMGSELDGRSDIYSFGLLMYEVLTGLPAFKGGGAIGAIISRQLSQMPATFSAVVPKLMIPDSLERIIFKAIQKKPDDRYASMDELRQALNEFGTKHGIKLPESTVARNSDNFERDRFEVFKKSAVQQKTPLSDYPTEAGQDTTIQTNYSSNSAAQHVTERVVPGASPASQDATTRAAQGPSQAAQDATRAITTPSTSGQDTTRRADSLSSQAEADATKRAPKAKPTPAQRSEFGMRSSAQDAMRRADFGLGAGIQGSTVRADVPPSVQDNAYRGSPGPGNGSQDATTRANFGSSGGGQDETVPTNFGRSGQDRLIPGGDNTAAQEPTVRAKFGKDNASVDATTRGANAGNQSERSLQQIPAGTYAPHTNVGIHPDDKRKQKLTMVIAGFAVVIAVVSIASLASVFINAHHATSGDSKENQNNINPTQNNSTFSSKNSPASKPDDQDSSTGGGRKNALNPSNQSSTSPSNPDARIQQSQTDAKSETPPVVRLKSNEKASSNQLSKDGAATHKKHSPQKRPASSANANDSDEAFLEHVYVKRHRGDAIQQMLDIKEREQSGEQ